MKANKLVQNASLVIRQEIQRFESVHPSIYAIYELIELIPDKLLQQQIRDHIICIESSFVNSQEWTFPQNVKELKLGILGSEKSGKAALVYRYLTGSYTQEESLEGGRYKKEVVVNGESYLLLMRDEANLPDQQFADWIDAIMFVFSVENENSFATTYNYFLKLSQYRSLVDIPIILVGTQDYISSASPRLIDDTQARKLANDMLKCSYYETCATYGFCVEQVFQNVCEQIVAQGKRSYIITPCATKASTNGLVSQPKPRNNQSPFTNDNLIQAPKFAKGPQQLRHLQHDSIDEMANLKRLNPAAGIPKADVSRNCKLHQSTQNVGIGLNSSSFNNNENSHIANNNLNEMFEPHPTSVNNPNYSRDENSLVHHKLGSKKEDCKKNKGSFIPTTALAEVGVGRVIPIKQGWLYKKSSKSLNKEWKKKYVTLNNNGTLIYHSNILDYMANENGKEISLLHTTVKVPGQLHQKLVTNTTTASSNSTSSKGVLASDVQQLAAARSQNYCDDSTQLSVDMVEKMGLGPNSSVSQSFIRRINSNLYQLTSSPSSQPSSSYPSNLKSQAGHCNLGSTGAASGNNPNQGGNCLLKTYSYKGDPSLPPGHNASEEARIQQALGLTPAPNSLANSSLLTDTRETSVPQAGPKSGGTPLIKKKHRRIKSGGIDSEGYDFIIVSMDNKQWHFDAGSIIDKQSWVSSIEAQILSSIQSNNTDNSTRFTLDPESLSAIKNVSGNGFCVDCETPGPEWASLNLGALMCIECSGIHRNLGTHISRVRSLQLDDWPPEYVKVMKALGNTICNSLYERSLKGRCKPSPNTKREDKEKWIRAKYELKEFLPPLLFPQPMYAEQLMKVVSMQELPTVFLILAHSRNPSVDVNRALPPNGRTALHLACSMGNVVITQLLLWNEANPYLKDKEGHLPLDYARKAGSQECVNLLSKHHHNSVPPHPSHSQHNQQAKHIPTTNANSSTSSLISFWKINTSSNTR